MNFGYTCDFCRFSRACSAAPRNEKGVCNIINVVLVSHRVKSIQGLEGGREFLLWEKKINHNQSL